MYHKRRRTFGFIEEAYKFKFVIIFKKFSQLLFIWDKQLNSASTKIFYCNLHMFFSVRNKEKFHINVCI